MLSITHIITGLETGGAEMMLTKLLSEHASRDHVESRVVSLLDEGPMAVRIRDLGVPVTALNMPRGRLTPGGLWTLYRLLHTTKPDIVQTWMYHADLVGGVVARLAGIQNVLWNIRSSTLERGRDKRTTIWTARICAFLSRVIPDRIITCAREAGRVHADMGYDDSNMQVISNGFDTETYRPSEEQRTLLRNEMNVHGKRVVGLVARYHPQKDHRTFVEASALLSERVPETYFVLCGTDVTWQNRELVGWIENCGMRERFSLLGRRNDVAAVMNAFDVAVLSSATGEAFPNVVGEAMACGVPCVVTRVGDSADIVTDTGISVPTESPKQLADGCEQILTLPEEDRKELGRRARERVERLYSLEAIADEYLNVYQTVSGLA